MNPKHLDIQVNEVEVQLEKLGQFHLSLTTRRRIWQKANSRANLSSTKPVSQPRFTIPFLRLLANFTMALSIVLMGIVWASTQSLPGDTLYSLARGLETVQLALAPATQRTALEIQFLDRHAMEVQQLIQLQRPVPPEVITGLSAVIETMASNPERYGGAAVADTHLALQEETLRLVVSQHPNHRVAVTTLDSVIAARLSLEPLLSPTAVSILTITPTLALTPSPTIPMPTSTPKTPYATSTPITVPTMMKSATPEPTHTPSGQEKTPPGQEKTPPGQELTPPGQELTPPGQEKKPPDQIPPGQEQTPPGQEKTPPGQGKKP